MLWGSPNNYVYFLVSRKTQGEEPFFDIGTKVFVDIFKAQANQSIGNANYVSTLTCIGERPSQTTIDHYFALLKSTSVGLVIEYFYDQRNVAVGGILKPKVLKNCPTENHRILFDRRVAYFFGWPLEKADVKRFFEFDNVNFVYDANLPLDPQSQLVVRAKSLLTCNQENWVYFQATYVFVAQHISQILINKQVRIEHHFLEF
jgi:hypothetical protein